MSLIKGALFLYLLLLSAWVAYFLIKLGWEIGKWWKRKVQQKGRLDDLTK